MKWETIKSDTGTYIARAPIFEGWLVMTTDDVTTQIPEGYGDGYTFRNEQSMQFRSSITFVPDPNHVWNLKLDYSHPTPPLEPWEGIQLK